MIGNVGCVGALPLRYRNRDGRKLCSNLRMRIGEKRSLAYPEVYIVGWLGRPVDDVIGHIAQQDRATVTDAENNLLHVITAGKQRSCIDPNLLVLIRELSRLDFCIRGLSFAATSAGESVYEASFDVLSSTRIVRGCPPRMRVSETSSTCLIECSSSSAIKRRW